MCSSSFFVLTTFFSLGGVYDETEQLYERSLATREKALGSRHPDVAQSLKNRAALMIIAFRSVHCH